VLDASASSAQTNSKAEHSAVMQLQRAGGISSIQSYSRVQNENKRWAPSCHRHILRRVGQGKNHTSATGCATQHNMLRLLLLLVSDTMERHSTQPTLDIEKDPAAADQLMLHPTPTLQTLASKLDGKAS
jgi:hypothetical protein